MMVGADGVVGGPAPLKHAYSFTMPSLKGKSDILTDHRIQLLVDMLPLSTQGYSWMLRYSAGQHGFSFHTFFNNAKREKRSLLLVETLQGEVGQRWPVET